MEDHARGTAGSWKPTAESESLRNHKEEEQSPPPSRDSMLAGCQKGRLHKSKQRSKNKMHCILQMEKLGETQCLQTGKAKVEKGKASILLAMLTTHPWPVKLETRKPGHSEKRF